MNIKDHGLWLVYRPTELPQDAPTNAMFTRRKSDGTDWYDYVNAKQHFARDSIKMTVIDGTVGAAVIDPTMLFPGNAVVLEISGTSVRDPQEDFGGKVYDADSKTFRDPPLPQFPDPIAELIKRIEALEKKEP